MTRLPKFFHQFRPSRYIGLISVLAVVVAASLFVGSGSAATPTFKQARANEINSGTVNNVAFTSANSAGSLIVVQVLWNNTGAVTMSDTRGNVYAAAGARTTWSSSWSAQIFYAKNVAAGANTVRATFATAINSFAIVQVHEYSGMDKVNPLDVAAGASGSGTAMNSGSATTTNANDLLFGGGGSIGTMTGVGSGYTMRLNTSGNRTMDRNVASAGSYSAAGTHGGGAWVMQMAAFKADAGTDTTAPSTPANLTANVTSPSQINVAWNPSTDNVGVTGYQVERCQGSGCTNFTLVTTVTGTSYPDTGLSAATTYRYRVRATDAAGNLSGYSSIATATTQGTPDTIPPSVPTGLNGSGTSISQINLSWTAATDNVGVTGYKVFRNGTQVGTSATTSFQDTGLTVNTAYSYAVSAYDAAGNNSAQSPSVNASTLPDTTAPTVPTNLAAQVVSSTQINLSWNVSSDNVGVAGYKIYRDGAFLKTSAVTPVQDSGLVPGTTYSYRVSAFDAAGNESGQTVPVVATTPAPDTTPPSASMSAPASGSTVSGTVTVSASASDNVAVADVDFLLDGVSIGVDTTAPYSISWNTTTTSNGPHSLSARARDTAGNFGVTSGVVSVTVSNSATPPLPIGLVGGWNFNEASGPTSADVTGNNNTATLRDSPLWTAGKYGSGLSLDGVNDYLSILNSPTLNLAGNAMTFSAWVNPVSSTGDRVLFAKPYNGSMVSPYYQYAMELGGGVSPVFYIGMPGGLVGASMGSSLPVGQWSHLAVVFTGTQAQFYVNGVLVSSPGMIATMTQRDTPLQLGADASPGQFFNGTIDDVRVYNRVLSAAEVQTDRDTPLQSPNTDPSAPTVSITSPANNAQASGIVTISADANDDVGVAGVQFFVDGTQVSSEDTTEPYGANWDTRVLNNGAHTITARARDTAGNVTVSAPITVNVGNNDHFQNEILATGLDLPTAMKFLPDGRMLVAELQGRIKILPAPYTTADPNLFLQIANIGSAGVQQGIFDFVFDPNFATNHYYYVFYTAGTPNEDRLSRFTANATNTATVPGSELILYTDPNGTSPEHHGGGLAFANDGKLFFTTGEHFQGTPAQDLTNPRGKIHRINTDGTAPTDNPFYDGAGPNWDSVWALGLRNPFRAYYDAPTSRLFIGDVGGNVGESNEEINLGIRGANYGWPNSEGACSAPCTSPLYDYEHNNRDASVTGGFVYHGTQFPSGMQGNYFFADYAQNWIKRMTFDANGNVTGVFNFEPADGLVDGPTGDIVYLMEGPDGALYYIDLGYSDTTGTFGISKVRRIRYLQSNQAPIAMASANPATGPLPLNVVFSSAGSNDPEGQPITYSWDFGDGSPLSTAANPTHTYTVAGQYTVRLTVSDGVSSTFSTPIIVSAGSPPAATLSGPVDGLTFRAGDVISYGGDATDPEDGTLAASAFRWNIDFLHDGHVHPAQVVTGVKSGTFTIPTSGHDFSGNTRYRITLTVTDSNGLTDVKTATVFPQKVNVTFNTAPGGLTVYVDGIAHPTPFVYDTLVGFTHSIEARNQTSGSTAYTFASWSDSGTQMHNVTVPAANQSYTATYTSAPISNGPAAAWGFNEGSGTTSADGSGNNNTATLVNSPTWVTGKHGAGVSLDGLNDYLALASSSSLDISGNAFAMSMWINPGTVTGDSVVMGKFWNAGMTSPYYQYGLELSGGTPHFYIGTASGLQGADMGTALTLNQWTHLAIVFNGSQVQFYANGTLVNTQPLTASITARGQQLRFGADADTGQFFKGLLDDVRIYNRTLNAAEVQTDMNTGV